MEVPKPREESPGGVCVWALEDPGVFLLQEFLFPIHPTAVPKSLTLKAFPHTGDWGCLGWEVNLSFVPGVITKVYMIWLWPGPRYPADLLQPRDPMLLSLESMATIPEVCSNSETWL